MPQPLLQRLRERKLFRWVAAYLAGAWVLFEVSDAVGGRLGWPDAFYQALLAALIVGFFVALVLAWFHGERGRQKVGATEALFLGALLVGGAASVWLIGVRALERSAGGVAETEEGAAGERAPGTIAVLAFDDLSESGDQAFFAEGMTEEILGVLARIPGMRVAARTSAFSFQGTNTDVRVIGGRLDVRHVLEGTVRRDGDLVRISARLVDTRDGFEVWSQSFTRELTNVIEIQEDIARVVASELLPQLSELPAPEPRTAVAEAHLEYLRGRYHWHRQDNEAAIASFEQAIALDSALAGAWAGLGSSLTVLAVRDPGLRDRAIEAVERAIALDPESPDALAAKARSDLTFHYDWAAAEAALERSVSLDPNHIETRHWYSHVLSWTERPAEAVAQAQEAVFLDPLSPFMNLNLGNALRSAGRLDEAITQIERTVELERDFGLAYRWLWDARLAAGRVASATEALVAMARFDETSEEAARLVGEAIAEHRRTGDPVSVPDEAVEALRLTPEWTRRVYGQLGQDERVLESLLAADEARTGSYDLLSIKHSDNYPTLRADPRFQELKRRIGPP